jgi:hypothetical protein
MKAFRAFEPVFHGPTPRGRFYVATTVFVLA